MRFADFRKKPKRSTKKGVEAVAAAIARGDFATAGAVLDLSAQQAALSNLAAGLEQYNRTRLAHRLGEQLATGAAITPDMVRSYFDTTDMLIQRVADTL